MNTTPSGLSVLGHRRYCAGWMPAPLLPSVDAGSGAHAGGDGGAGAAGGAPGAAGDGQQGGQGAAGGQQGGTPPLTETQKVAQKYGFPPNTPVADMTPEQQAGYYRASKDQWENRWKSLGVTPEELVKLREAADRQAALEEELASDGERAANEAKRTTAQERDAHWLPKVIAAEFRGQLREKGFTPEQMDKLITTTNLGLFATAKGDDVDIARVTEHLQDIYPGTGGTSGGGRGKPGTGGQGNHGGGSRQGGAAGLAEAQRRFGKTAGAASA